ncbi:HCL197Wp [Eremothecium sinecaudum]|uniref:HCL197Wp n=1 Tax=Eremothecium sinecaudum TaxID=45286 RepID=A0A0X8HR71_9SACH|nr:HCL197Wp [Eremothecium sinecaudum]AMD19954.1 HCL197Wp [Eremothecium sinecaudum]
MTFWWKKSPKTPGDYVKHLTEQLSKFELSGPDNRKKVQDECTKYITGTKDFMLGETDPAPTSEAIDELYSAIYEADLLYDLLLHLHELDFESRKDVALIFATCLRRSKDNKFTTVDYLVTKPKILSYMLRVSELALNKLHGTEIFLTVGGMILESMKYEQLCRLFLRNSQIWNFFEFARLGSFEVSTESLQILTELFTTHTKLVATEFFNQDANIKKFIDRINMLMAHGNYVTKRQSVKLLRTMILNRAYGQLMNNYINSPENLKLSMILLSDRSKNLQLESFNVFKVVVANPRKSKPVLDILIKNRDKLLKFFENFGLDTKDSTLLDEKEFVVAQIEGLPRLMSSNTENNLGSSPQKNVIV